MLKANKSIWFEKIFSIYNRNLLKRRFHSVKVGGMETLEKKDPATPLLTFANHSSWWDGLVLFELFRQFKFENYVMMEERQLKDLRFFRKLGAFSVVRENPREALESVNFAVKKLRETPDSNVLIFPQGEILPSDLRPLKFFNGLSKIIQKSEKCCLTPISLKYEFLGEFKPFAFIKVGTMRYFENIKKSESKTLTNSLAADLTDLLEGLKKDIINGKFETYQN